jgi:hypothetical protein
MLVHPTVERLRALGLLTSSQVVEFWVDRSAVSGGVEVVIGSSG